MDKGHCHILVAIGLVLSLSGCVLPGLGSHANRGGEKASSVYDLSNISRAGDELAADRELNQPPTDKATADRGGEIKGKDPAKDKAALREIVDFPGVDPAKKGDDVVTLSNSDQGREGIPLTLQFEDAPLRDILDTIVIEVLGGSYVMGTTPTQKVSLNLQGSFSKQNLEEALRLVLESMDLTLAFSNGIYNVLPAKKGTVLAEDMQIMVLHPDYVKAENIIPLTLDLKSGAGKVAAMQGTNVLFMLDYPSNLAKMKQLVQVFDVPVFQNRYIRVYKMEHAVAVDVAKDLDAMLKDTSIFADKDPISVKVMPLERLNRIVVVTTNRKTIDYIDAWIATLDQPQSGDRELGLYYYIPKYSKAEDLAKFLGSVFKPPAQDPIDGMETYSDTKSNMLVMRTKKATYLKARTLIDTVDRAPRQVYIQAILAEVKLGKNMDMGFQWFLQQNINGRNSGALEMGSSLGDVTGKNKAYTLSLTAGEFFGYLSMMAANNTAKIIATPHIFVKDGDDASIEIKRQVPVIKSFLSTDIQQGGTSANQPSIEYKDAGIILKVKCRIPTDDQVEIDVEQEVSSPTEIALLGTLKTFEFNTRKLITKLLVRDQQTVLLGGMREQTSSLANVHVPLLGQIPVLKTLFNADTTEDTQTELVLFLTPVLVNDVSQLDGISKKLTKIMVNQNRQEPVEKFK